jgi:hypothetical protein
MAHRMRDALPDLLRPGVQLVFIGTAAGQRSPERAPTTRRTKTVFGPHCTTPARASTAQHSGLFQTIHTTPLLSCG